eukprot:Lankesteria_metandrocarpae@DN4617_c0_g1_i1.p1
MKNRFKRIIAPRMMSYCRHIATPECAVKLPGGTVPGDFIRTRTDDNQRTNNNNVKRAAASKGTNGEKVVLRRITKTTTGDVAANGDDRHARDHMRCDATVIPDLLDCDDSFLESTFDTTGIPTVNSRTDDKYYARRGTGILKTRTGIVQTCASGNTDNITDGLIDNIDEDVVVHDGGVEESDIIVPPHDNNVLFESIENSGVYQQQRRHRQRITPKRSTTDTDELSNTYNILSRARGTFGRHIVQVSNSTGAKIRKYRNIELVSPPSEPVPLVLESASQEVPVWDNESRGGEDNQLTARPPPTNNLSSSAAALPTTALPTNNLSSSAAALATTATTTAATAALATTALPTNNLSSSAAALPTTATTTAATAALATTALPTN